MNNFSPIQFLLRGICFLAIQQGIMADNSGCNTPKLGPNDKLTITIFDSEFKLGDAIWDTVCGAVKKFPKGLISVDYRPGVLAKGSVNNIQCGSGNCKPDQIQGCMLLNSEHYNDCFNDSKIKWPATIQCYCSQSVNKYLLDNAALRASWNIPENVVPTLIMNQKYDSCVKFKNEKEMTAYLCAVYQNKVGQC